MAQRNTAANQRLSFEQLFALAATVLLPAVTDCLFCPISSASVPPSGTRRPKAFSLVSASAIPKPTCVRAVLEGIIYGVYSIGRMILESNDPPGNLRRRQLLAKQPLAANARADTFNKKVVRVADDVESSALGAVIVGMEALNGRTAAGPNSQSQTTRCIPPIPLIATCHLCP